MKDMMKGLGIGLLAVAAVIAGQTGLSFVVGFHTAQLIGETALGAMFLYAVVRAGRKGR